MRKMDTLPENAMSEGLLEAEASLSRSLASRSSKMVLTPAEGVSVLHDMSPSVKLICVSFS